MIRRFLRLQGCEDPCEVRLERKPEGPIGACVLHVAGDAQEIEITELGGGTGFIRMGGRIHRYFTARRGEWIDVWLDGKVCSFEAVDRAAKRSGTASAQAGPAGDGIAAPMPGTILKIHVSAGDMITAHQPLVVMESMKMEMTLAAPRGGRVHEVRCEVGQLVEIGKLLVTLEPAKDE